MSQNWATVLSNSGKHLLGKVPLGSQYVKPVIEIATQIPEEGENLMSFLLPPRAEGCGRVTMTPKGGDHACWGLLLFALVSHAEGNLFITCYTLVLNGWWNKDWTGNLTFVQYICPTSVQEQVLSSPCPTMSRLQWLSLTKVSYRRRVYESYKRIHLPKDNIKGRVWGGCKSTGILRPICLARDCNQLSSKLLFSWCWSLFQPR